VAFEKRVKKAMIVQLLNLQISLSLESYFSLTPMAKAGIDFKSDKLDN
jgi:hypothetical protein